MQIDNSTAILIEFTILFSFGDMIQTVTFRQSSGQPTTHIITSSCESLPSSIGYQNMFPAPIPSRSQGSYYLPFNILNTKPNYVIPNFVGCSTTPAHFSCSILNPIGINLQFTAVLKLIPGSVVSGGTYTLSISNLVTTKQVTFQSPYLNKTTEVEITAEVFPETLTAIVSNAVYSFYELSGVTAGSSYTFSTPNDGKLTSDVVYGNPSKFGTFAIYQILNDLSFSVIFEMSFAGTNTLFPIQFEKSMMSTLKKVNSKSEIQLKSQELLGVSPFDQFSFQMFPIGNMEVIIRIHVVDPIGFVKMFGDTVVMDSSHLVSGTLQDGIFENRYSYLYQQDLVFEILTGTTNYRIDSRYKYKNVLLQPSPQFPITQSGFSVNSIKDITYFQFQDSDVNLSTTSKSTILYFNVTNANKELLPYMKLKSKLDHKFPTFVGEWDYIWEMYRIDIQLPARIFTGTLEYDIFIYGYQASYIDLISEFGGKAMLNVTSAHADEFPPIVIDYQPYPLNVNGFGLIKIPDAFIGSYQKYIGYSVIISDPINGLKNGTIRICSSMDSTGFTLPLDPLYTDYSGNTTLNYYNVQFPVDSICVSQTFIICDITLVDQSGYTSSTSDKVVNPLFPALDVVTPIPDLEISCTSFNASDITGPTLVNFSPLPTNLTNLDVGTINRIQLFSFSFTDFSGIHQYHLPILTLVNSADNTKISCQSEIAGNIPQGYTYNCSMFIPYGFGVGNSLTVQFSNIFDNFLRPPSAITLSGGNAITPIISSQNPYIDGHYPFSSFGGRLVIFGHGFGNDSSATTFQVNYNDGKGYVQVTSIAFLSFTAMRLEGLKPSLTKISVRVSKSSVVSNEYFITPVLLPVVPTQSPTDPPPNLCPNQCGGPTKGECHSTGCKCISPWSGIDCRSTIVIVPEPKPNPDSPDSGNNYDGEMPNGEKIQLSTLVSIKSIRELDINNLIVFEKVFDKWEFINTTSDSSVEYQYKSNVTKPSSSGTSSLKSPMQVNTNIDAANETTTKITVTIQWFSEQETIVFANELIEMNPSTLKYKIELDSWPFSSSLNRLEIVMAASLSQDSISDEESTCQLQEFQDNPDYQYLKLSINEHSFYGRFIKRGIVDGQVRQVDNQPIKMDSGETNYSSIESYIGITVPYYKRSVILDPDFSVLLDSDTSSTSDNSNAICNSVDSGLSKLQIIGIAIGCAGFGIVIIASVAYFYYKKIYVKRETIKLKSKLSRSRE
ncbi:EGF-like domain-containing protein [Tieghemostelium lacteum]|uniref:EGF-like domain-containing protein n=1 Tax=Tieghemostelium lacteum TaxID=361077 RepID=A0A152A9S7_TIELA|nr:EGF-like domain-containing protein [Tieghemostelium lacteum]|eukprot:KYR02817.1 EGF-like domain-containing protein [Tieghemostelium lacteum]